MKELHLGQVWQPKIEQESVLRTQLSRERILSVSNDTLRHLSCPGRQLPSPTSQAGTEETKPNETALPGNPGHSITCRTSTPIETHLLAVSPITNGQNHCLSAKPPNDGGADPAVSRLHKALIPFWKTGRTWRQVATLLKCRIHTPVNAPC